MDKPMSKSEARAFVKRSREGLRWIEEVLAQGGSLDDLTEACNEAIGSVAAIQDAAGERGVNGVTQ